MEEDHKGTKNASPPSSPCFFTKADGPQQATPLQDTAPMYANQSLCSSLCRHIPGLSTGQGFVSLTHLGSTTTGSPVVSKVAFTTKALSTTNCFEGVTEYLIRLGYLIMGVVCTSKVHFRRIHCTRMLEAFSYLQLPTPSKVSSIYLDVHR